MSRLAAYSGAAGSSTHGGLRSRSLLSRTRGDSFPKRTARLCAMVAFFATAFALLPLALPQVAVALHDMPCADMDGDGIITQADADILFSYLGQTVPPAPPQADVDPGPPIPDDDVDIKDWQFVLGRIGLTTACQDTPIGSKVAVGGLAVDLDAADESGLPLQTADSSGMSGGVLAGLIAGIAASALGGLGGAAWYARRRPG